MGYGMRRAIRALWTEVIGFRTHYPLEVSADAGRKGARHYYVYSDRLFLNDLELDGRGIPRKRYRLLGLQYNPLFVAWWGLVNLHRCVRHADRRGMDRFLLQVEWLREAARERDDGGAVWPCYFDWHEGACHLRAPWISAMYQAVVISTLVRGYRVTGDERLLSLARRGTRVFEKSVEDGGVRTLENGGVLYEEYPGYPLPRVLDGFLFSLLGLYDLYVETGDSGVGRLFSDGIDGLRRCVSLWDYRGKWSWYGRRVYLCPPHYHALNTQLLSILGCLTEDRALSEQASRWAPRNLSWADRIEIYTLFVTTKNWTRLRSPNEKGG